MEDLLESLIAGEETGEMMVMHGLDTLTLEDFAILYFSLGFLKTLIQK
jgi:hypothetical protein